jgi:DNA-binding NarL/FixJ family response regulator
VRIVVGEDSVLFREGLVRLLGEAGHDVVAEVDHAERVDGIVAALEPDLCVLDIRMPPGNGSDGAHAARRIRGARPHQPVLVLSQHVETRELRDLLGAPAFGYLLKDRVLRVEDFLEAAERVVGGGSAIDPEIVRDLVTPSTDPRLAGLTSRELEVLALAAEGLSNASIAARLVISERTAEAHMRSVFARLGIAESAESNRRVLAVLAYVHRR